MNEPADKLDRLLAEALGAEDVPAALAELRQSYAGHALETERIAEMERLAGQLARLGERIEAARYPGQAWTHQAAARAALPLSRRRVLRVALPAAIGLAAAASIILAILCFVPGPTPTTAPVNPESQIAQVEKAEELPAWEVPADIGPVQLAGQSFEVPSLSMPTSEAVGWAVPSISLPLMEERSTEDDTQTDRGAGLWPGSNGASRRV